MKTNKGIRTSTEMTHKSLLYITKVFITKTVLIMTFDFPGGASGKEPASQCRRTKRLGSNPWVGKIPWRRKWQPTPVFLPGESHGQRSLAGYSPRGCKESDTTEQLSTQHTHG